MSYKYSTGSVRLGDVYFEDDRDGLPTYIDFGQDTITLRPSGSAILYAESTKVGINTMAPESYLDIKNTIDDGATNRTMIRLHNYREDDADENDWAPTSLDFVIENVAGGVKGATARIATVIAPVGTSHNTVAGERSSALIFSTMDDNTLSEAIRINNVGNVGIGTNSPDTLVHLKGSSPAVTLQRNNNSTDTSTINFEGSAGVVACQVGQVAGTDNELAFSVHDGANLLERVRIAENGSVGIGTTDPNSTLEVNGSVAKSISAKTADYTAASFRLYTFIKCIEQQCYYNAAGSIWHNGKNICVQASRRKR